MSMGDPFLSGARLGGMDPLPNAILELAKAINRLADTQEKPVVTQSKTPVSFSIANFEDQPDGQTAQMREVERERSGDR